MEDLIKRRSPVRANFKKRFNASITALNEENLNRADIEIKFCSLERIATDLAECDGSIRNALLDAKSEEYEEIEEYREKLDIARICVKAYFEKLSPISESQLSVIAENPPPKLKLPKIKLIKFGDQYLSTPYHDTSGKLKNSFYVDNCVTSVNSEKELRRFIEDSTNLMAQAKFDLRGWEFTGEAILLKDPKPTHILGLLWDRSE
ncbi:hypothetical protein TNCT_489681 [Trichonephila clavata]|uniref:Uncharacterized protein n=1 Tax=Trichonephila clavata TaxID=2740835 RepID=A0A8X6K2L5_TRICU|nr:hypothetical protein TNCT_489681 [Trichonephila clavata]